MNEIVNKFLLAPDELMSEMYLRRPGFTYSVCGPFYKNQERIRKFKDTGNSPYIYQDKLEKACFQHDMTRRDFKDLTRRAAFDRILHDKAFNIIKNPKYDERQGRLALMVYKFSNKKLLVLVFSNKELGEELHRPMIRNFKKRKLLSSLINNIWGIDLANMQLISKSNEGFRFLLCFIDTFSIYAWVIPLKNKK